MSLTIGVRLFCWTLVGGSRSVTEIAEALGVEKSGNITDSLQQLEEAGLVSADAGKNPMTGVDARERRFRLRDNYVRFYLKYIEPVKDVIDAGAFAFTDLNALAGWQTTMGLAFENLVVNNYRRILEYLHLGRALVTSAAPYVKRGSKRRKTAGCQVDLLVQTAGSVCLVEIKRREQIGMEVIDEMRERVAAFPKPQGKSVRTALVYDGFLAPTVEANGYFDAIIPFGRLLA